MQLFYISFYKVVQILTLNYTSIHKYLPHYSSNLHHSYDTNYPSFVQNIVRNFIQNNEPQVWETL